MLQVPLQTTLMTSYLEGELVQPEVAVHKSGSGVRVAEERDYDVTGVADGFVAGRPPENEKSEDELEEEAREDDPPLHLEETSRSKTTGRQVGSERANVVGHVLPPHSSLSQPFSVFLFNILVIYFKCRRCPGFKMSN